MKKPSKAPIDPHEIYLHAFRFHESDIRLRNSILPEWSALFTSNSGNSGSFHCISDGEDPKSKEISWQRPFNTYFLFIVRPRNSCINDPIRSTSSSNAKWPVSRRWSSALGISLLKRSAPFTVKIPSFLPQVISVGGCCLRKYSCQSA